MQRFGRPVSNAASLVRDPETETVSAASVDSEYADLQLRTARSCLESVLLASIDALIVCDHQQKVVLYNQAAERMFDLPATPPPGLALDTLLPDLGSVTVGDVGNLEAVRSDGSVFAAQVSAVYGITTDIPVGCVVVRDVSERAALEAQLRQSQKMDALGQLAGGVAHDFNNLLTVIFGNLELARREVRDRPSTVELLSEVERASNRAAELTRQLLSFSRKRVLEPRYFSLDTLIRNAERLFRRVLPESITLETVLGADPAVVHTDPGQLEQALMNLVVNARDAMPSGGSIVVETAVVDNTTGKGAPLPDLPAGRYATLSVRDNGSGISSDVQKKIFEPFFTTKEPGQGTGLGLTMVYGVAMQSGGTVQVESATGRGSVLTIVLPVTDGAPAVEMARPRLDLRGTETILLVEDESAVRASTRRMLERQGYTVLEARHGSDALALWRSEHSRIGLVISDVRMPEMGGTELLSEIRRESPDAKFLLVSGYAELEASPHLTTLGVPFVEKPFTVETLLARVRHVLDAK